MKIKSLGHSECVFMAGDHSEKPLTAEELFLWAWLYCDSWPNISRPLIINVADSQSVRSRRSICLPHHGRNPLRPVQCLRVSEKPSSSAVPR